MVTRAIKLSVLAGMVSLVSLIGCGGDDGGDDDDRAAGASGGGSGKAGSGGSSDDVCKTFKACGGKPEGVWSVQDVCLSNGPELFAAELGGDCADAFRGLDPNGSGSYTLTTDKATANINLGVTFQLSFSDACVKTLGLTGTAAAECKGLEAGFKADTKGFESASCQVKSGACACDLGIPKMTLTNSAAYTVQGNNLVSEGTSQAFCVKGNTLTIQATLQGANATFTLTK